ncbi:hypothetical protein [Niveibacterium terrae]|uniref:hypothetical protein n=1 Tax=Niveibacterium terrae TaxID=3373598 RepID=UPI003A91019E
MTDTDTDTDTVPATETGAPLRPAWVWVIFLYNLFSLSVLAISLWATLSGKIPLSPAQKAALTNFSSFDIAQTVVLSGLSLAAAIQIFRLRKSCVPLFCSVFGLGLLTHVWEAVTQGRMALPTEPGQYIGWAIDIAICTYAWRLSRDGVLR